MKAVVQRVSKARVLVDKKLISQIGPGFLVFLGVAKDDKEENTDLMVKKIAALRILSDSKGKMNKSIQDSNGEILLVSQFTLLGNCKKGNRPSFINAARPEKAKKYYDLFCKKLGSMGLKVKTGVFQAYMEVEFVNDGPVTIILEN
ncbi:D-aminoacyl-tRNA deacylase [Patescibacteria group bacterium]